MGRQEEGVHLYGTFPHAACVPSVFGDEGWMPGPRLLALPFRHRGAFPASGSPAPGGEPGLKARWADGTGSVLNPSGVDKNSSCTEGLQESCIMEVNPGTAQNTRSTASWTLGSGASSSERQLQHRVVSPQPFLQSLWDLGGLFWEAEVSHYPTSWQLICEEEQEEPLWPVGCALAMRRPQIALT